MHTINLWLISYDGIKEFYGNITEQAYFDLVRDWEYSDREYETVEKNDGKCITVRFRSK